MILTAAVTGWYAAHARDLPWRQPGTSAWGVLVSEIMLQQTPVARVLPAWQTWLARWPTPADLAADSAGEAVRAWGRLGYPRRALRLHGCATVLVDRHGGGVPQDLAELRALPGVGTYTAAAVAAFAYGQRVSVLDTNVRRVLARLVAGAAQPVTSSPGRAEQDRAAALLPADPATAALWSVSLMELGALVCTARSPRCEACPVASRCAWLARGRPAGARASPAQTYAGTDRQCRGRLLAVLRDNEGPVHPVLLDLPGSVQRARALDSLLADGLVQAVDGGRLALPGTVAPARIP